MITIDQAMRGAIRYVDTEISPHLPAGKALGVGIVLSLLADGGKERLLSLARKSFGQSDGCDERWRGN